VAGQERRGTRGRGRSQRDASSSAAAAGSEAESGSSTEAPTSIEARTAPDPVVTRATYRALLLKGLAPDEAANLTAFICGIQVGDQRWTLREVNRLLFLRELQRTGRVTDTEETLGAA
jgi:hypothetical protein